ncbi:MAG: DUF1799 domain-containing protein [Gammaproteobacteria bacterium]|nr:DUF1799 domain-containing protein [Gammaproteobacteria bacterium]
MNFTEEQIKEELAQEEGGPDKDCEIWPEHVEALDLFLSVQRRWVYPAMSSRPVGLDPAWVTLKAELMFPEKQNRLEVINQVELIERGALGAWPKS